MSVQHTIIKGIKEQLFLHNYLVLPGFGGFVLKARPSHFSASGGMLLPPSKIITFNGQLKQNDGILAIWLQHKLACGASDALTHLKDFTEFCTGVLNTRRRLTLDSIGFFYLDFENNICFEPQQDTNYLSDSFGLAPVSVTPLEIRQPKKEIRVTDRVLQPDDLNNAPKQLKEKVNRRYLSMVATAFVIIPLSVLLLVFISQNKIGGELRSSLFGGVSKNVYTPLHYPELKTAETGLSKRAYVADANGIATLALDEEKTIAVRVIEKSPGTLPVLGSADRRLKHNAGGYEIILGCFAVHDNARRLIKNLSRKNITAGISGRNAKNMYVVSVGDFSSREAALDELLSVKASCPNAWIKQSR